MHRILWCPWPGSWPLRGAGVRGHHPERLRRFITLKWSVYGTCWPVSVKYISPHRASFRQIYKLRDWNKTQRGKTPKKERFWPWNIHIHELWESRITVTRHTQTEELWSQHFYLVLLKWKLSFRAAAHKAVVPELIYPTIATPTINFLCCRRCKCNETAAQKLLSPVYTGATNNSQRSQWLIWFITDLWAPDSRKTQIHKHFCKYRKHRVEREKRERGERKRERDRDRG